MLDSALKSLADGKNFATITTLLPDGQPTTHVMWVGSDDSHILVNTEVERKKYKNILRDPRVSVTIIDAENPYHYAEVRGRVVDKVVGEKAKAQLEEMSRLYTGGPYQMPITSDRVLLYISPDHVRVQ